MSDWRQEAACRGKPTATWYPERAEQRGPALTICAGCEVTANCLAAALAFEASDFDRHGLWGGLTADERKQEARRARRVLAST